MKNWMSLWQLSGCVAVCVFFAIRTTAQTPELPAAPAPAAPAKSAPGSIFHVPAADLRISASSTDMPAKPPAEVCFAAAEGLYAPRHAPPGEVQVAAQRYTSLAIQNLSTVWHRGLPRAANDPWLKGAQVIVRFAILPDGSTDTPRVTVSSGRASYDKAALEAIYKTPFAPLPEGIEPALPICMKFRYNLDEEQHTKPIDLWPPPAKPGF
jgi:TonB family protein